MSSSSLRSHPSAESTNQIVSTSLTTDPVEESTDQIINQDTIQPTTNETVLSSVCFFLHLSINIELYLCVNV